MKTIRSPRVGDECWEVEWCKECAVLPDDPTTHDPDRDKMTFRLFATREAAWAFAHEVYPQDQHGSVRVTHERFLAYDEDDVIRHPWAGYWEATADSEFW